MSKKIGRSIPANEVANNSERRKRILLGQLNSNGDCLYATTIARQIKYDYPGCHLTWAIGSMCRSILDGNPYVDDIWEVNLQGIEDISRVWKLFENEAFERKGRGYFDEVFLTQIAPGNLQNYDGSIRSSIFRGYPYPVTVPLSPTMNLSPVEVERVRSFAGLHRLTDKKHVILFECSPKSGQSFVTPDFALELSRKLVSIVPDSCLILSSNIPIDSADARIIDGSVLTFRENAELTKYCTLLVGCSSGISWLCTSEWAKPLPMIQLINPGAVWFASFVHDHEFWGLPTDSIIEISDSSLDKLLDCIIKALSDGFDVARREYHERIPARFDTFGSILFGFLINRQFGKAHRLVKANIQRNGLNPDLLLWLLPKLLIHGCKRVLSRVALFQK